MDDSPHRSICRAMRAVRQNGCAGGRAARARRGDRGDPRGIQGQTLGALLRHLGLFFLAASYLTLAPPRLAAGGSHLFTETGQTSSNAFYDFWLAHGQTAVIGLPLSPTFRWAVGAGNPDKTVIQVYERAVLEWHPENAPGERVQLERLGDDLLDLLQADQPGQRLGALLRYSPPDPCEGAAPCIAFAETNHTLRGTFSDRWNADGGLRLFGYPLTEQFPAVDAATGEDVTVQYFERSRFESHAASDGGSVLLGRLGASFWDMHKDVILAHPEWLVTVPDLDSTDAYLPPLP